MDHLSEQNIYQDNYISEQSEIQTQNSIIFITFWKASWYCILVCSSVIILYIFYSVWLTNCCTVMSQILITYLQESQWKQLKTEIGNSAWVGSVKLVTTVGAKSSVNLCVDQIWGRSIVNAGIHMTFVAFSFLYSETVITGTQWVKFPLEAPQLNYFHYRESDVII